MQIRQDELQRMRDGEKLWGNNQTRELQIPASGAPGTLFLPGPAEFEPQVVDVHDVKRCWGLRFSVHIWKDIPLNESLSVSWWIQAGLGLASFTQLLTMTLAGPIIGVPAFGFDQTQYVPDFPAETIQIQPRYFYAYNAGAARVVPVRVAAAAAPYTSARGDL